MFDPRRTCPCFSPIGFDGSASCRCHVLPQALRCVCDRCLGARVLRLEREDSCDMDGFERCTHEETAEETVTRRCVLRRDHAKFGHDDHVMD